MTLKIDKGPFLGVRHLQALLIFFNVTVIYVSRLNIGLALVVMTNVAGANPNFPQYEWNEQQRSYILSSFYWGYIFTQFPGGYLCRHYGAKIVMFSATFGSSLCTLIVPFCTPWGGWQVFCVIRMLQGLFQGMAIPCIYEHLAKWSPVQERNRLGTLCHMGTQCGTILATSISGVIAAGPMGWPGLSYVAAGMGLTWCVAWLMFASNNATESRCISVKERIYIESSLERGNDFHKQKIPIPWREIFTSVPFFAWLFASCCMEWGSTTMLSQIPAYMYGVLDMDIKSNAFYTSLPYIAMWISSSIFLIIADVVMKRKLLSLTALRKTFNTIGMWLPAAFVVGIGFLDKTQKTWAIVLNTLNGCLSSGVVIGTSLNIIDLSPNHVGVLMGIGNGISSIIPIISPLIVGAVIVDEHDSSQWQIIFIVSGLIFFVGNLVFIIFGTTEVQPWNDVNFNVIKDIEENNDEKVEKKIAAS